MGKSPKNFGEWQLLPWSGPRIRHWDPSTSPATPFLCGKRCINLDLNEKTHVLKVGWTSLNMVTLGVGDSQIYQNRSKCWFISPERYSFIKMDSILGNCKMLSPTFSAKNKSQFSSSWIFQVLRSFLRSMMERDPSLLICPMSPVLKKRCPLMVTQSSWTSKRRNTRGIDLSWTLCNQVNYRTYTYMWTYVIYV